MEFCELDVTDIIRQYMFYLNELCNMHIHKNNTPPLSNQVHALPTWLDNRGVEKKRDCEVHNKREVHILGSINQVLQLNILKRALRECIPLPNHV